MYPLKKILAIALSIAIFVVYSLHLHCVHAFAYVGMYFLYFLPQCEVGWPVYSSSRWHVNGGGSLDVVS